MLDPLSGTLLIATFPLLGAVAMYFFIKHNEIGRKEWYFLFGFISVTAYFVFASAPEVVYKDYAQKGDYTPVVVFGVLAMMMLFIAIYFFRRHLE